MWSAIILYAGSRLVVGAPWCAPISWGLRGGFPVLLQAAASAAGGRHGAGCAGPSGCSADADGRPELPGSCPRGCVWC